MQLNITVVQVEKTTKPTAKGSYQQLEVTFKNLESGKLESKKIMSFASKDAFNALVGAKQGDTFSVDAQKNDKTGYWDWVTVTQNAPGQEPQPVGNQGKTYTPAKSTYETPEERAKKQVFIIKQSALTNAREALSVGAKVPPAKEEITALAQYFTDWVMETPAPKVETLTDMDDDVPF